MGTHQNLVDIEGVVKKIWTKAGDTCVRLAAYDAAAETIQDADGKSVTNPNRATLLFLGGKVQSVPAQLKKFDHIRVFGYLTDRVYYEDLAAFASKSRNATLQTALAPGGALAALRSVTVGRTATYVVVTHITFLTK